MFSRVDDIEHGAFTVHIAEIREAKALAGVVDAGIERCELAAGDVGLVVVLGEAGEKAALGVGQRGFGGLAADVWPPSPCALR